MRTALGSKIEGCLIAAALGDAMGAAAEHLATHEIIQRYGGLLRDLTRSPEPGAASQGPVGEFTDDASQMLALARALVEGDGDLTDAAWTRALTEWADSSPMARYMGPTTRPVLQARAAGQDIARLGAVRGSTRPAPSFGATNGAAMRVAPAGLVRPGDIAGAVRLAWVSSRVTHDTQLAAAGAGAIAAGVARALQPGASVFTVAGACLDGARLGEQLGIREGRRVPGPNVARRIELAVAEASQAACLEEAIARIEATVGNSVMVVESVPAAVGIFVAAGGDPFQAIVGGVNIGNDADTIATMAGALAGALRGPDGLPPALVATLLRANSEDLRGLASDLTDVAWRRYP